MAPALLEVQPDPFFGFAAFAGLGGNLHLLIRCFLTSPFWWFLLFLGFLLILILFLLVLRLLFVDILFETFVVGISFNEVTQRWLDLLLHFVNLGLKPKMQSSRANLHELKFQKPYPNRIPNLMWLGRKQQSI